MKSFRSARMKYEGYLKSDKEKESASEKETQVLQVSSDIENLCSKCSTLERTIKMLYIDFIQCIDSTEEKDDIKAQKETKSELDILFNYVKNLKEKRRKLLHQ